MLATIAKLTDRQLTATISSAHRALTIHKAAFLIHLAEFDERGLGGSAGTVSWLMRTQDLSRRTAYEQLGVGRRLREFPELTDYFSSGDINYSKVRFLLPYLTHENEAELVRLARTHTLQELETLLAGRPRADGRSRQAKNRLSVGVDKKTGGVRFWGTLDPANGAEFLASLKSAELAMGGEKKADGPDSSTTRFGAPLSTSLLGSFMSLLRLARHNPEAKTTAPGAQVSIIIRTDDTAHLPGQPAAPGTTLLRGIINDSSPCRFTAPAAASSTWDGPPLRQPRPGEGAAHAVEPPMRHSGLRPRPLAGVPPHRPLGGGRHHRRGQPHPAVLGAPRDDRQRGRVIVPDAVDLTLLRFRFPAGRPTRGEQPAPMLDLALGEHADGYTHGPVPRGDEDLLDIWEHEDTFDDIDADEKP